MNMSVGADDPVRPNTTLLETVRRGRCPRSEASTLGVHRPAAPAGAALPPYTPPNAPRERPLPLPLGEVAERSEDGEGKQKRTASGRFFSLSINLSCHSEGAARPWASVIF